VLLWGRAEGAAELSMMPGCGQGTCNSVSFSLIDSYGSMEGNMVLGTGWGGGLRGEG
jgi:hypothetical protein